MFGKRGVVVNVKYIIPPSYDLDRYPPMTPPKGYTKLSPLVLTAPSLYPRMDWSTSSYWYALYTFKGV